MTKFRSWNEIYKRFYYFSNGNYFDFKGNVEDYWRFNWKNAEQFIGLYDVNKVEIYESDYISDGIHNYEVFYKTVIGAYRAISAKHQVYAHTFCMMTVVGNSSITPFLELK